MLSAMCLPIRLKEGTLQAWLSSLVFGRCLVRISGRSLIALAENYRDFPQSLQINSGLVLRLCHFRFLSLPFHFVVHESNYSTPCCFELLTASLNKHRSSPTYRSLLFALRSSLYQLKDFLPGFTKHINLLAPEIFFLILAHPVYKM